MVSGIIILQFGWESTMMDSATLLTTRKQMYGKLLRYTHTLQGHKANDVISSTKSFPQRSHHLPMAARLEE